MNAIFLTVKTDSSRLPKKALLPIGNETSTLQFLIKRLKKRFNTQNIIVCTTDRSIDDQVVEIAVKNSVNVFRGSLDKLERWLAACKKFDVEFFVTVDGDDLFCDPSLISMAFAQYENNKSIDFIHSTQVVTGGFSYAIKRDALAKVCDIKNTHETEMMWVYFTQTNMFNVVELEHVDAALCDDNVRLTLDYDDDYRCFQAIIAHFEKRETEYSLHDIVPYLKNNKHIANINLHRQEDWKKNQAQNTKLVLKTIETQAHSK